MRSGPRRHFASGGMVSIVAALRAPDATELERSSARKASRRRNLVQRPRSTPRRRSRTRRTLTLTTNDAASNADDEMMLAAALGLLLSLGLLSTPPIASDRVRSR